MYSAYRSRAGSTQLALVDLVCPWGTPSIDRTCMATGAVGVMKSTMTVPTKTRSTLMGLQRLLPLTSSRPVCTVPCEMSHVAGLMVGWTGILCTLAR